MDHHHHNTPAHHQPSPPTPQPAVAVHHVSHQTPKYTDNKPTVRFYCKAKPDYSLTIRDGKVVLAPTNPSDHHQHWIKEEKYSTRVKDEEGFHSFALVNKATGQAIKHSIGAEHPVQLVEYNPDKLDESVLWTQSKDLGDGFHAVRMVNNIKLNVDAWNGDKDHGGVHDGTKIYLFKWTKGDNQRWTTAPFCIFMARSYYVSFHVCLCVCFVHGHDDANMLCLDFGVFKLTELL
ncbi:putative ricin B-like lectin [Helianthus debilis subsp. tardiflorus]